MDENGKVRTAYCVTEWNRRIRCHFEDLEEIGNVCLRRLKMIVARINHRSRSEMF